MVEGGPKRVEPQPGGAPRDISQYGRGEQNPATGLYEWYEIPDDVWRAETGQNRQVAWRDILTHWSLVEADLHERYGLDVDQPGLLKTRTWRWLRVRIVGLLETGETRIARALTPQST